MSSFLLEVNPSRGTPYTKSFSGDVLVMGRSKACDLILYDDEISRRHARLISNQNGLFIEDLNSRNGTYLNERAVEGEMPVAVGEVIRILGNTIRVVDEPSTTVPEAPTILPNGNLFRSASELLNQTRPDNLSTKDEQTLRKLADQLATLNEVHDALSKSMRSEDLLALILDRVFQHLGPEEAGIYIKDWEGKLTVAARRILPGVEGGLLHSQTLIQEVAENGKAALIADLANDERFSHSQSMLNAGIRSLVAAPLLDGQGVMGMIVLASRIAVRRFSEEDMALLVSLASLAGLRLRNLALIEENNKRLREDNQLLECKVAERTVELERINEELRGKNAAILRTQNQLVMQEKMASLGTMAAGVAHQIKNPLNFVKNLSEVTCDIVQDFSTILKDHRDKFSPQEFELISGYLSDLGKNASITHSHGVHADQIVVGLMEYTRESNLESYELDLSGFIKKYSELSLHGFKAMDLQCPIEIRHEHEEDIDMVTLYAGDFSRGLLNLINNCVEALVERYDREGEAMGKPQIKTVLRKADGFIELVIKDNGSGIRDEHLSQIYTPFFSTKHQRRNIGLGLSVAYDTIVQQHRGQLRVTSEVGKGTRVVVRLPQD